MASDPHSDWRYREPDDPPGGEVPTDYGYVDPNLGKQFELNPKPPGHPPPPGMSPPRAPHQQPYPAGPHNPYAAPQANVGRPWGGGHGFYGPPLATRTARLGAHMRDRLLVAVTVVPAILGLMAVVEMAEGRRGAGGPDPETQLIFLIVGAIGLVAFTAVMGFNLYYLAGEGQTLGKKAVGIRTVRSDGRRAGLARLVFLHHFLIWFLDLFCNGFLGLLDALFIFGEERRCLHNYIADTIVVEV